MRLLSDTGVLVGAQNRTFEGLITPKVCFFDFEKLPADDTQKGALKMAGRRSKKQPVLFLSPATVFITCSWLWLGSL